ncbi:MAG: pilus assembly protein PilP [Deltaproteobacteria bacterium]|nr:pilus assembly protein PilP [Deltaproteobacteria bacterium]
MARNNKMENRRSRWSWGCAAAFAIAMIAILPGCGGSEGPASDTPAATDEVAKTAPATKTVQEAALQAEYRYESANKPDPFRPFILLRESSKVAESPLRRYDLAQLQLTAVVWNVELPKAMVADPTGRSHVIQIGSDIGKNRGIVTNIGDREVRVKETYIDYLGHESQKSVTLKIVQPDLYGEES